MDASSPLVGTDARKAKQAERLASRARVRSSIRRDLSAGKDSSVPPVGSQQDAEQPAVEEDIEEGLPASATKFGAAKLFNENVPEMSKDNTVFVPAVEVPLFIHGTCRQLWQLPQCTD